MISCCLAAYSLVVLKRGFSIERKDASSFLKDITWLSVARFSPGIHHKDICVSFGALCQACRLPKLSAHLPHGGKAPATATPRQLGRCCRTKTASLLFNSRHSAWVGASGLHSPADCLTAGTYVQWSEVRKAGTGSSV